MIPLLQSSFSADVLADCELHQCCSCSAGAVSQCNTRHSFNEARLSMQSPCHCMSPLPITLSFQSSWSLIKRREVFFLWWGCCEEKLLMKEWWMAQLCCCLYSSTFICISTRHRSQDSFFTFQCSSSLDPVRARTNQTSTFVFASRNMEQSISPLTPLGPACDGKCSSPPARLLSSVAGWFEDLIPAGGYLKCTGSHHYTL